MFKSMILVALVGCLAQHAWAVEQLDCEGVKQIAFDEMKQSDNICHFLVEKTEKDYSAAAFDKMRVCACNLINKGFVWSSLFAQVKQIDYLIVARRRINGAVLGKTLEEYPVDLFTRQTKEEVRDDLLKVDKLHGDGKTIEEGCKQFVPVFTEFAKMIQNLNTFANNRVLFFQVIQQQPKIKNLLEVYAVCAKAAF